MNGYSILLHNIGPGKIVIKVELITVALQNIFKTNFDKKTPTIKATNHYILHDLGL